MTPKNSVLPVTIALAGTLLGFFLGASARAAEAPGAARPTSGGELWPTADDTSQDRLIAELRTLGDRIVALHQLPATGGGSVVPQEREAVSQRQVVAPPGPAADITQLLDRCTTLLERLERRVAQDGESRLSLTTPRATREDLLQYDEAVEGAGDQFQEDHVLWGYQQVLDRYGKPDSVSVQQDGSVRWYYELFSAESLKQERGYRFYFSDGLLVRARL